MRRVGAVRAALANLFFSGLGYVYLGRLPLAVVLLLGSLCVVAVVGRSGLFFEPVFVYVTAALLVTLVVFTAVHAALIALRHRELAAKPYNRWWFYVIWIVLAWFLSDLLLSNRAALLGYEPFRVPSSSMAPTVERGDFIMTNPRYSGRNEPALGQIFVFRLPGDEDVLYIKRIVGLPGDAVEIRDDVLYRNGEPIDEPYVLLTTPERSRDFGPITVPEDSYFLLGDNRHNSLDSRTIGAIPARLLHGRAEHRWFAFEPGTGIRWERFPERLSEPAE